MDVDVDLEALAALVISILAWTIASAGWYKD